MFDTSQHHNLLHLDELRNVPLSSYFLRDISIESRMGTGRQKWFSLDVGSVEGRKLFGPLTWMNSWGNAEAGNSWVVYINMINIALINHINVIYCCFSHMAPTRDLWSISQRKVHFLPLFIQTVLGLSGSFNSIMVLQSTAITQRTINVPIWSLTSSWLILFSKNSCWGGTFCSMVQ